MAPVGGAIARSARTPGMVASPMAGAPSMVVSNPGAACLARYARLSKAPGCFGKRSLATAREAAASADQATTDDKFANYKPTTAFFFPGQGAQSVGMAKDVVEEVPAAKALFDKAADILGYNLLEVCSEGPKEKLDSTAISQPAIYVSSLAAVEKLRAMSGQANQVVEESDKDVTVTLLRAAQETGLYHQHPAEHGRCILRQFMHGLQASEEAIDACDVTCGLSLGEYTALAFADALTFEDGLNLVKLRGEAMQAAADAEPSAMVSVIGLDAQKVTELCEAAGQDVGKENQVQIANFLCPGNYAVSGSTEGCDAVEKLAKDFGARMTVRLAVAGAFHTRYMQPAVEKLKEALAATSMAVPRIPVISNVDAQPHSDPQVIKDILSRQVTSPVLWENTIRSLLDKGLVSSCELGPGKVIAGIMKRIDRKHKVENIAV